MFTCRATDRPPAGAQRARSPSRATPLGAPGRTSAWRGGSRADRTLAASSAWPSQRGTAAGHSAREHLCGGASCGGCRGAGAPAHGEVEVELPAHELRGEGVAARRGGAPRDAVDDAEGAPVPEEPALRLRRLEALVQRALRALLVEDAEGRLVPCASSHRGPRPRGTSAVRRAARRGAARRVPVKSNMSWALSPGRRTLKRKTASCASMAAPVPLRRSPGPLPTTAHVRKARGTSSSCTGGRPPCAAQPRRRHQPRKMAARKARRELSLACVRTPARRRNGAGGRPMRSAARGLAPRSASPG
eukprot:scaffold2213_cov444-Prasinococcus_capsulatus_cf.AAC.25